MSEDLPPIDLSARILTMSDTQLQKFLVETLSDELLPLMIYHMGEEARALLLRNMSQDSRALIIRDLEKARLLVEKARARLDELAADPGTKRAGQCILFTDLEGSTERGFALGDPEYYDKVLSVHVEVVSRLIRKYHGRIIKEIGDAFLATFVWQVAAVLCCVEIQRELAAINDERPESTRIRIRAALHVGDIEYRINSAGQVDLFGGEVNYAARLVGQAEGGQIVISSSCLDSLSSSGYLAERAQARANLFGSVVDAGSAVFKGYPGEQRFYAIRAEDIDFALYGIEGGDGAPPPSRHS